jgi:hypothetical protein
MVDKIQLEDLRRAVEGMHGGKARLVQSVPVTESHDGAIVWEGVVHVFELTGHLTATRAYAWSSPIEGSESIWRVKPWTCMIASVAPNGPQASNRSARPCSLPRRRFRGLTVIVCDIVASREKPRRLGRGKSMRVGSS